MLVEPEQSKGEKTLETDQHGTSPVLCDNKCSRPRYHGVRNTNLSVVGHGAKEQQLQVESAGLVVQQQPQAAGQVLSEREEGCYDHVTCTD